MKVGLVLGKFAPLHRGHQLLIETALAETDHVIVLIYDCPELPVPGLPIRSAWIRKLYPAVEVCEAWDGPTETGLELAVTQRHDAYLQRRLGHRGITHFFSSEDYGAHVSRALGAVDRRVDPSRQRVPISATQVRLDLFANRQLLAPGVYRDLITQVVLLGAPSTGKTTLAAELARRYQTTWMPEYGREYWNEHQLQRRLTREQLLEIALEHRRREEDVLANANRFLFIDTDASTTLQFSYYYHESADPRLIELAGETRLRYDLFLLCSPDIPYEASWDRSGDVSRSQMQRRIEADLWYRKVPYVPLAGSLDQRCQQVMELLQRHAKPWSVQA